MIPLIIEKLNPACRHPESRWSMGKPFVENSRGTLVHRLKSGSLYNIHKLPHIGVSFWCGMSTATSSGNLTFLDVPPKDKILCERCEAIAVERGQVSADELAGFHVHKCRTKAVITCCKEESNEQD